ncbi:hypothetical protein B0H14DRAFT_2576955 [Mycena olivaceomarginata]|nr:hypothetical protein B0H14DRAFT_2576955 [Mycena olivaceomarginata]
MPLSTGRRSHPTGTSSGHHVPQRDMHHLKELRSVNVGWPCVCHLRDSLDRVPVSSVYPTDIFSIASDTSFGQILEQCGGNSQIIPAKPHQVKIYLREFNVEISPGAS